MCYMLLLMNGVHTVSSQDATADDDDDRQSVREEVYLGNNNFLQSFYWTFDVKVERLINQNIR